MKIAVVLILLIPAALAAPNIRLVKPVGYSGNGTGRVEVFHNGQWGTICDAGWDKNDAAVVCNELGFVKVIHETRRAKYGQGKGPVWLNDVRCKGDEQRLIECPHSGWGTNYCKHWRDAGVKCLHEGVPQILEVGCYQDHAAQNKRALTDLYLNLRHEVDWYNMRSMVTKCAEGAHELGYKYFGIQFFGECWGSKQGQLTFDKHGKGVQCYEGVGAQNHNFIYRFAPWKDLGCWHDVGKVRAMTLLENFRSSIDWFHLEKTVEQCYQAARKAKKTYFAVQFYGECWVSDDESYQKHGFSTNCVQGVGKHWTNYVYQVLW